MTKLVSFLRSPLGAMFNRPYLQPARLHDRTTIKPYTLGVPLIKNFQNHIGFEGRRARGDEIGRSNQKRLFQEAEPLVILPACLV